MEWGVRRYAPPPPAFENSVFLNTETEKNVLFMIVCLLDLYIKTYNREDRPYIPAGKTVSATSSVPRRIRIYEIF